MKLSKFDDFNAMTEEYFWIKDALDMIDAVAASQGSSGLAVFANQKNLIEGPHKSEMDGAAFFKMQEEVATAVRKYLATCLEAVRESLEEIGVEVDD